MLSSLGLVQRKELVLAENDFLKKRQKMKKNLFWGAGKKFWRQLRRFSFYSFSSQFGTRAYFASRRERPSTNSAQIGIVRRELNIKWKHWSKGMVVFVR